MDTHSPETGGAGKRLAPVLVLLAALAVVAIGPANVHAQDPQVYEENFDDNSAVGWEPLPSVGWEPPPGSEAPWRIVNPDEFNCCSLAAFVPDSSITYVGKAWGEGRFDLKFELGWDLYEGMEEIRANMHLNGSDRYAIGLRYDAVSGYGTLTTSLFRQEGVILASEVLDFGGYGNVEIASDGGQIDVWVALAPIDSYTSPTSYHLISYFDPDPLPPGAFGFENVNVSDGHAQIDDIEVSGPYPAFTGQVLDDDTNAPLQDVPVRLLCFNAVGELVTAADTLTDSTGAYRLSAAAACDRFILMAEAPSGYEPLRAESIGGTVQDSTIEYPATLGNRRLDDNNFYMARLLPDLTVESWSLYGFEDNNQTLRLTAWIYNRGGAVAPETSVSIGDPANGWPVSRFPVPELPPGGAEPMPFELPVPCDQRGSTHTLEIRVDPSDEVVEGDETNNVLYTEPVDIPPLPLLAFSGHVFQGLPDDTGNPQPGITVGLFCADDPDDPGSPVASTSTDAQGGYTLEARQECPCQWYNLVVEVPEGQRAAGCRSPTGTRKDNTWIQFPAAAQDEQQEGNDFWLAETLPDLVIESVALEGFADEDELLVLSARITNQGDADASETTISIGDPANDWPLSEFPVPAVPPGGTVSVEIQLPVPCDQRGSRHTLALQVDPSIQVGERDETNNGYRTAPIDIPPLPLQEFSGHVFQGQPDDTGNPQRGITVGLFYAEDPNQVGSRVASTSTDEQGGYALQARQGCPGGWYNLVVEVPEEQRPAGCHSPTGTRKDNTWIQYPAAQQVEGLGGNDFWLAERLPDLVLLSAGFGRFEDEDRSLVLIARIANQGDADAPATSVSGGDPPGWPPTESPVGPLPAGTETTIELRLPVPRDQRGTTHRFSLTVDPSDQIAELDKTNNVAQTERIDIPAPGSTSGIGVAVIITILVVVVVSVTIYGLNSYGRDGGRRRPPHGVPIPPPRLIHMWLRQGSSGKGPRLTDRQPLTVNQDYTLHLQIQPGAGVGRSLLPAANRAGTVQVEVRIFTADNNTELDRYSSQIEVPRGGGASREVALRLKPQHAGHARLRVCVYYRNTLLQSAVLEAAVAPRGARIPAGRAFIVRTIDYVASSNLSRLDLFPPPAVSIVTNRASDGTHWIGVFSSPELPGCQLRSGSVYAHDPTRLPRQANRLRERLERIEGAKGDYYFAAPPALDPHGRLVMNDPAFNLTYRENDICELAVQGYRLYSALFLNDMDAMRLSTLEQSLHGPGIVSVARCGQDSLTLPWAVLYDLPLNDDDYKARRLCPIFKQQLAENVWTRDEIGPVVTRDLLDQPETCRANPQCPVRTDRDQLTVCPFGFWGFLHQVEQPLQQVTRTRMGQLPKELVGQDFNQSSFLVRAAQEHMRLAMFAHTGLDGTQKHWEDLNRLGLGSPVPLDLIFEFDCDRVKRRLAEGGRHLYYFFCHGRDDQGEFRLELGTVDKPGTLSAAALRPDSARLDRPHALVMLNGCETMAVRPDQVHDFLPALRARGAYGIVGTEIKVYTGLARPFGLAVLQEIVAGRSIGEAFLTTRRNLLRQLNPLGLAYTYYSPATLHLHTVPGCTWCQQQKAVRLPGVEAWLAMGGKWHPIQAGSTIGRSASSHVRLEDGQVSRSHAQFKRQGTALFICDAGSANGTWVNGQRVTEAELHDGDVIQVGNTQMRFQRQRPA